MTPLGYPAPRIPHSMLRVAAVMEEHIDFLGSLMGARFGYDDRGRFACGFGSQALAVRAAGHPTLGTSAWFEAEGARIIFQALNDDRKGSRFFAADDLVENDLVEDAILASAKARIGAWCREYSRSGSLHLKSGESNVNIRL